MLENSDRAFNSGFVASATKTTHSVTCAFTVGFGSDGFSGRRGAAEAGAAAVAPAATGVATGAADVVAAGRSAIAGVSGANGITAGPAACPMMAAPQIAIVETAVNPNGKRDMLNSSVMFMVSAAV